MQSQTKECKRCREIKSSDSFAKATRRKDGLQPWCRECVAKRDRERYLNDKKKHRSWNTKRRDKYYDMVTAYLHKHPCVDCGEADPIVLEFDHRDPEIKDGEVTKLLSYASWDRIVIEMEKCDVVCSNCHRKRTSKQFGWRRWVQQAEQMDQPVFSDKELDEVVIDSD